MTNSIFLKIEGIPGESTDERHAGELELISFQWGERLQTEPVGGRAGKVLMEALSFTAASSKASPRLFLACASGKHIPQVVLSLARGVEGRNQDFFFWKLSSVLVSAYRVNAAAGASAPLDEVELTFEKIELTYRAADATGGLGEEVSAGWDLKSNRSL